MVKLFCIILSYCMLSYSCLVKADYTFVNTDNSRFLLIDDKGQEVLKFGIVGFQPGWKWLGNRQEKVETEKGMTRYHFSLLEKRIEMSLAISLSSSVENQLKIETRLKSNANVPLSYLGIEMRPGNILDRGKLLVVDEKGSSSQLAIPLVPKNTSNTKEIKYYHVDGENNINVRFKKAVDIHHHGGSRLKLFNNDVAKGDVYSNQITIDLIKPVKLYDSLSNLPSSVNRDGWFEFKPRKSSLAGEISLQPWLDHPAIKHKRSGEGISNENRGKVWGTNVEYDDVAPPAEVALQRAKFFAKYGINSVRLHKLTNPSWEGMGTSLSASIYDKGKLSRFDYALYELKNHGITYGFSPIWNLQIFDGDRDKLVAFDEIVKSKPHKPVTTGLVWFAKDVQNLHIETLVNLLNHKNPHSGQIYAEDPSLVYIELQNEENVFFYTFIDSIKKYPTYHKMLAEQFSDWLVIKYKNESGLIEAWGRQALNTFSGEGELPDESLKKRNIVPVVNPWLYDNHAVSGNPRFMRLQDSAEFLFEKQNEFYSRATKAIRETGFKGMIVGSNWQAGSRGAHFLNLLSDSKTGVVDRHNYQGGARGSPSWQMLSGHSLDNTSMLSNPGSGLLSVGMQQVANNPFMYSEWLAVVPSEWAAADTTLVAAYGFGLQGWDMSYHFASNGDGFSPKLNYPGNKKFNNLTPVGVGLFPVLARMVLRRDINEAEPIATRRLSKRQAIANGYDFKNKVDQKHDAKSFGGTPHHNALAVGKVLVEFTKEDSKSTIADWKIYQKTNLDGSKTISSTTGQLHWTYLDDDSQSGFVEINSEGTQGIVGFAPQKSFVLDDISLTPHSKYSVIMVTAKSPVETLSTDDSAILMAIARAHNTDMKVVGSLIADAGKAPVILEPVKATITFKRPAIIHVLDHDGVKTGKVYELNNGIFEMDTAKDKAIYYLVEYLKN